MHDVCTFQDVSRRERPVLIGFPPLQRTFSHLSPTMLPLSLLAFVVHLIQAESSQSAVNWTEVLSTLIPPNATYNGPGSANYYASIIQDMVIVSTYATTYLPPSNCKPEVMLAVSCKDPCQKKLFGTGSQAFYQAMSVWGVTRAAASCRPVVTQFYIADPWRKDLSPWRTKP